MEHRSREEQHDTHSQSPCGPPTIVDAGGGDHSRRLPHRRHRRRRRRSVATGERQPAEGGGGDQKVAIPNFDAKTWKPTAETPLPPLESPITFNLSDEPSY